MATSETFNPAAEQMRDDEAHSLGDADLTIVQEFTLDLAAAGKCYERKARPANRRRQRITRFLGRLDSIETFAVLQTFPVLAALNADRPTERQVEAVEQFYGGQPASRWQAHTMLCARDYGLEVARSYAFSAMRRMVIAISVSAFILGDRELRDEVRRWCEARHREPTPGISAGIAHHRPYKAANTFGQRLVKDLRGAGSQVFG